VSEHNAGTAEPAIHVHEVIKRHVELREIMFRGV
jgi:hypothetical protein